MLYVIAGLILVVPVLSLEPKPWWKNEVNKTNSLWKPPLTGRLESGSSTRSRRAECECMYHYLCSSENQTITDGFGVVSWKSVSPPCGKNKVCCFPPEDEDIEGDKEMEDDPYREYPDPQEHSGESITEPTSSSPKCPVGTPIEGNQGWDQHTPTDDGGQGKPKCPVGTPIEGGVDVVEGVKDDKEHEVNDQGGNSGEGSSFFVCGTRVEPSFELKVSGSNDDTETAQGEFPWMLLIKYELPDQIVLVCGASLVLPSIAITAAHCIDKKIPEKLRVVAGEWDLGADDEEIFPQERRVQMAIIHPKYDLFTIKNDIAILLLDTPFEYSVAVNTICLPSENEKIEWGSCYATGWGATAENSSPNDNLLLRKAKLPLVFREECEVLLRRTRLANRFKLHKSFICAGGDDETDTCKGDGGGPLACRMTQPPYSFYLVGITSWGVGCSNRNIPGVYTDVSVMSDWVGRTVKQLIETKKIPI